MADGARRLPGDDEVPGLSVEERALRELMRHAVDGIQPGVGALPRIRQAVPRRRAARRGAWTGAAALALAVAIALPVLHEGDRLGLSGGPGSAQAAGPTLAAPSGGAVGGGAAGPGPHAGLPGGEGTATPTGSGSASPSPGADPSRPGTATPPAVPGAADGGIVPLCTRTDLGQGTAQIGAADAQGRIYGSFTVYNVSGHSCRVGGPGAVAVTGVSGADRSRVRTADHAPGDPAAGLPAMDAEPPVLSPQAGYKVPFAWIPDQGCGTGGSTGAPTNGANQISLTTQAPPVGSSGAAPDTGTSAAPSANPQASSSPTSGPTPAPSPTPTPSGNPTAPQPTATIAHTPAPGSPAAATASLPVECGGTLYRGGVQPAGGPAAQPSGTPAAH
ncbi:hypothetical protein AB0O91_10915 [Kitasatospora sp. NPDC089797]|uniref:hypothetical protein n=1 Tax=Kitasatospora sp. NPDC089797 TaxID=3155298 RepID=UPI00342CCF4C